uniref:Histone deacetylase domain-containing protein n=1 Tax=Coccolithus braarudii TaxID=221442 RepID=A0A7S0Q6Z4_9EUKA|mmetsp:Transcript_42062/g.89813  ORF Transcript_42062/g.89813 Transcript_42062/m.89813 type:complete len:350 (+) Transcript_42062:34-1083(+)|eukprot:CAMPEP_0183360656 /NCGR_PEP_ID=MMETSP0164_2-20130417/55823_1 /TAXON_ID=221442 /ORGANISM="Coccolithus pelagicus ssp braarudi, Strain PLY182g" /LENGTH=349 /DNA_ID=CAMNT_0025535071 /DNA_START=34 /DNA_END=1083 /DNA_ORIENTATION=-
MLPVVLSAVSWLRLPAILPQQVQLYTSEVCLGHDPGADHPERPQRLLRLLDDLYGEWMPDYGSLLQVCSPEDADVSDAQLLRVHSRAHLKRANAAFGSWKLRVGQRSRVDADTIASSGSRAAARRAAGLVIAAVDSIFGRDDVRDFPQFDPKPRRAFCMVRPPGHHAEVDTPMGFCWYNNVLVGVAHAQIVYGAQRVAILDFDVHHGNGDADITIGDPRRLYVSSHETPNFPGTGETLGRDGKFKNIVNAPLPANSGSVEFRLAWRNTLLPAVRSFRPDAIFISAGFDAHSDDPLSSIKLTDEDYAWLTTKVVNLCGGRLPIVSVLEGGYNVDRLPKSVRRHVHAMIHS